MVAKNSIVNRRSSWEEEKQETMVELGRDEGQFVQGAGRRLFWERTDLFYQDREADHS